MARRLFFLNILLISAIFFLSPLYAQQQKKAQGTEKDVEELEALIEGRTPAAKAKSKEPAGEPASFYKSFGNGMSIRGDGKYFYIQAKETVITVDAAGHVQIEAAENILMKSKKSITLQADENIHLISGEGVVQSKVEKKRKPAQVEQEGVREEIREEIEETEVAPVSKEPAAQLPPTKAEAAEKEESDLAKPTGEEKKKAQEPESAPAVGAPAGAERSEPFEESESESESTLENE